MRQKKATTLKERLINIIDRQQLFDLDDIPAAELERGEPITKAMIKENGLDVDDDVLAALAINRKRACTFLLKKWIDSDKPQLQLAAFRILCDDDRALTKISNAPKNDSNEQLPPAINIQIIDNKTVTDTADAVDVTEQMKNQKRLKQSKK